MDKGKKNSMKKAKQGAKKSSANSADKKGADNDGYWIHTQIDIQTPLYIGNCGTPGCRSGRSQSGHMQLGTLSLRLSLQKYRLN